MKAMYSKITKDITFKWNYDNINEVIFFYAEKLMNEQKRYINYLKMSVNGVLIDNEINKKSGKKIAFQVKKLQRVYLEVSNLDFINKLEDGKAKYFYLVDYDNYIKKIEMTKKIKGF